MAKEKKEKKEKDGEGGGGMKKIILMVAPALVVGAGMFFFLGGKGADAAAPTTTLAPVEGVVLEVETITVNLVDEDSRYARLGFAVVLDSLADEALVQGRVPLMRDAALTIMTDYTSADLQSQEGMERLRVDLSDAMVALFPDGEVLRAVLTELIVQ
ncbi:MAG: flagellar basal body-associated FliL family protein [Acidimicrobiia bacterium]|nr:flagellar basal body-associated FliL family protein [Acidimicrobiia bacterium]MDH4307002.1 flagellar basal body-associated FliL family protein [Acidimicrobiia bacterium]MDH5292234.1 flagellar basal body-associated FliL family protein [Acidimicrobiia bacterium]